MKIVGPTFPDLSALRKIQNAPFNLFKIAEMTALKALFFVDNVHMCCAYLI